MSARYLRALAALACAACSMPDAAFFDLPVEPQHQAGLLVLGNQVHALRFEDGVLVDAPVRVAPDNVPNEVFFYAYQRSLAELGLQPGLQDLALEGGRLLPTPARSLQTQKTPVAWSPLSERWAGPIVDLRIEAPGGCLSSVETTRSIASTEPPLFAVALGAEGTWEETTLLVGLRGGALYAVTAETIQPIDQPVGDDVCNGPCRIGPIFRGFGRTLWFTYANTRTIALRGRCTDRTSTSRRAHSSASTRCVVRHSISRRSS
ncbi:MAG: hypothetical protein RMA76_32450 [Deltaproteobacteria bacterium]